MRKLGIGFVVLAGLAGTASADNLQAVYSSNGVFAEVDIIRGCTETTGVFLTMTTDEGTIAGFAGTSTDICGVLGPDGGPLSDGAFNYAFIDYKSNGLGKATASGSFTADFNNDHFEDLTFEFGLTFTGTGGTIFERMFYNWSTQGVNTSLDFSVSRRRAANVTGSITVNGDAIELLNPVLGSGVSGSINVNH